MQPTQELADQIYRRKVEAARAMSPEEKLFAGPRLFEWAYRIAADGIRHQFPWISEEEVQNKLAERLRIARELEKPKCPPQMLPLP